MKFQMVLVVRNDLKMGKGRLNISFFELLTFIFIGKVAAQVN